MDKIQQNTNVKNMHLHNGNGLTAEEVAKAFDFIDMYLPDAYIPKVLEILPEVSKTVVHNVRQKKNKKLSQHALIINALVKVAKEHKEAIELSRASIQEIINN